MTWTPHATVATIVEQEQRFLFVEEVSANNRVLNQPAGHIEEGESIFDAARRETLEETGWAVELTGFVGVYTYTAPQNGTTYYRFCFSAAPIQKMTDKLDSDILGTHWHSHTELLAMPESRMRSPLVKQCLNDYITKPIGPMDLIYEHKLTTQS